VTTSDARENPYRTPQAAVAVPDGLEGVHYAGFWLRAFAWLIDQILIQAVFFVLGIALGVASAGPFFGAAPAEGSLASLIAYWGIGMLLDGSYYAVCWHELGGSLGHLAVGARVRDARGYADLSWPQCVVRYLGCFVSWLPLGLGFAWAGIDARKQAWHDKIAATVVVRI
jgi:uncharacterized RDD family membrane protein YckC